MNVFDLAAKLTLDTSQFDSKLKTVGNTIKGAGKVFGAALGAATAGVTVLTKQAVDAYADYEQLVGGVETLFGNGGKNIRQYAKDTGKSVRDVAKEYNSHARAQKQMMKYADDAYKAAGLSANQYMETATSFAASMINSLGGDTEKAVEYTNRAVVQMSDNANKMGTDISAIQSAYIGFSKQNYMMLDNLKLGYGGTKTEMERLITDAEKLDSSFTAARDSNGKLAMSYSDIVDAIQIVQDNMGITGTTAKEAASTISGSLAMTQASWENLLTAMASGEGFKEQMDALVDSASLALGNILPVVENFLVGFGDLMKQVGPIIVDKLPQIISDVVPSMLDAAVQIVGALVEALPGILQSVVTVFGSLVDSISNYLNERWPQVGQTFDAIVDFAKTAFEGITNFIKDVFAGDWQAAWEDLKGIVSSINWGELGTNIMNFVSDKWNALKGWAAEKWEQAKAGLQSINWAQVGETVKDKIKGAWETLKGWAQKIWRKAVDGISSVDWKRAGETAKTWIGAAWSTLKSWAQKLWEKAKDGIMNVPWAEIGGKVKDAISTAWNALKGWATGIWNSAKAGIEAVNWKDVGDTIWKAIKDGIGSLVDNMKTLFETGVTGIKNVDWKTAGSDIWDLIKSGLEALGAGFVSLFTGAKDDVGDGKTIDWAGLGKSILDFIFEGMKGIGGLILGLFEAAWEDIQKIPWADLGLVIANWILDGMGGLGDWIRDKLDIARVSIEDLDWSGTGKEAASQVVDGMSDLPGDVTELGERAANGFSEGSGQRNVWSRVADIAAEKLTHGIAVVEKNITGVADSSARGFEAARWATHGSEAGLKVANAFKSSAEKALDSIKTLQDAINNIKGKTVSINIQQKVTTTNAGAANTKDRNGKISYNARAMDTGHIFKHPTLFGFADGKYQVAGDVGPEAVVGVSSLSTMIQESVNRAVGRVQEAILSILSEILDSMPSGNVVLDTGALVGGIADEMNDELGRLASWSGGGRA